MKNIFGIGGSFLAFMIINSLVFAVTFFFVPETEGLSYDQFVRGEMDKKEKEQEFSSLMS